MDVWFDDAYYKDVGGKATLTSQENAVIVDGINKSKKTLGKVDKERFNQFLTQPDLAEWVKSLTQKNYSRTKCRRACTICKRLCCLF